MESLAGLDAGQQFPVTDWAGSPVTIEIADVYEDVSGNAAMKLTPVGFRTDPRVEINAWMREAGGRVVFTLSIARVGMPDTPPFRATDVRCDLGSIAQAYSLFRISGIRALIARWEARGALRHARERSKRTLRR